MAGVTGMSPATCSARGVARRFAEAASTSCSPKVGDRQATDVTFQRGAFAGTGLNGNGLQEVGALAADYASVYSRPDVTKNRSLLVT